MDEYKLYIDALDLDDNVKNTLITKIKVYKKSGDMDNFVYLQGYTRCLLETESIDEIQWLEIHRLMGI